MKTYKLDEQLQADLFSAKTEVVLHAIETIKEKGNQLYIPVLFDLLNTNPEKEIESAVADLLGSVKEKQSVNSFIRAIEDDKYAQIRKIILAACWQNGLDFSTFIPVFIDVIIADEWETAFEAFTVADNLDFLPSEEIANVSVQKIKLALPNVSEQKQYFLNEILKKIS
jgi:HEAT repeat protein